MQQRAAARQHSAVESLDDAVSTTSCYTIDDALDRCGTGGAFHWLILVYAGLSWMCDSMEVMILSYLGAAAKCEWDLTSQQESLLASMVFLGMTLGAPVWGMVSDARGRKIAFACGTLITTVFGFLSAAAPNYAALMAFRCLVGFGIPAATVAFNIVLEFTPTKLRGMFAVGIEGFWTIGTITQAALAYALLNSHGWRILVLVSTAPYVLLVLFLPFLPESPRYLLVKGRTAAAERVLSRVMRVCRTELPEGRLQPLLSDGTEKSDAPPAMGLWQRMSTKLLRLLVDLWAAVRQLFSKQLALVTCILIFTWMVAAFVYYGLVQLVAAVDFVESGHKGCRGTKLYIPKEDLTGILITSSAEVPGLIFSLIIVAYLGRKIAFSVPLALIAVVLIPLMAGVKGVGVIVCMYLSRFFIYSSFNILWAMTPEYYPTSVRNFGLGVNNAFSRIAGLVSPFAVKVSPGAWPHGPEAIFAAFSLVAAGLVFLLPPDKKGQSLDDTLADVKDVPELQRRLSSSAGGGRRGSGGVGGGVKDVGVGAELDEEAVSAPEQVLLSPR